MKPYPFVSLNHFTVPVAMLSLRWVHAAGAFLQRLLATVKRTQIARSPGCHFGSRPRLRLAQRSVNHTVPRLGRIMPRGPMRHGASDQLICDERTAKRHDAADAQGGPFNSFFLGGFESST